MHDKTSKPGRSSGAGVSMGRGNGPTPGKRTRTSRLAAQIQAIQKRAALQKAPSETSEASSATDESAVQHAAARGVAGAGGSLPHQDAIQRSFGKHDIGGVKAHVGGDAAAASDAIGATAYATGNDVAFAQSPDLHTAAHEAAHVVQQRGGVQLAGGVGREGDSYEQHADRVADKVVAGQSAESTLNELAGGTSGSSGLQLKAKKKEPISARLAHIMDSHGTTKVTFNHGTSSGVDLGWSVQLADGSSYPLSEVTSTQCHARIDESQDTVRSKGSHVTLTPGKAKSRHQKKAEKKAKTVRFLQVFKQGSVSKAKITRGLPAGIHVDWGAQLLNKDGSPRMSGEIIEASERSVSIVFELTYDQLRTSSLRIRLIPDN